MLRFLEKGLIDFKDHTGMLPSAVLYMGQSSLFLSLFLSLSLSLFLFLSLSGMWLSDR